MKAKELPEYFKTYMMSLSNRAQYKITGSEKEQIIHSEEKFIELKDGSIINKSFIVEIKFQMETTKQEFLALPEEDKSRLLAGNESVLITKLNALDK